ncbi:hypothetical protein Goklo_000379, partial [Gossypium klotzschianum]|nr:hypothetical protein [Gossypium klotzschianum]
ISTNCSSSLVRVGFLLPFCSLWCLACLGLLEFWFSVGFWGLVPGFSPVPFSAPIQKTRSRLCTRSFVGTLFWPLVFEGSTEFVCTASRSQVCALFSVLLVVLTYLL